jgi:hypothetical protein
LKVIDRLRFIGLDLKTRVRVNVRNIEVRKGQSLGLELPLYVLVRVLTLDPIQEAPVPMTAAYKEDPYPLGFCGPTREKERGMGVEREGERERGNLI